MGSRGLWNVEAVDTRVICASSVEVLAEEEFCGAGAAVDIGAERAPLERAGDDSPSAIAFLFVEEAPDVDGDTNGGVTSVEGAGGTTFFDDILHGTPTLSQSLQIRNNCYYRKLNPPNGFRVQREYRSPRHFLQSPQIIWRTLTELLLHNLNGNCVSLRAQKQ